MKKSNYNLVDESDGAVLLLTMVHDGSLLFQLDLILLLFPPLCFGQNAFSLIN